MGYGTVSQDILTAFEVIDSTKTIGCKATSASFGFTQHNYSNVRATISGISEASVSISQVDWKTYSADVTVPINTTTEIRTATITISGKNNLTDVTENLTVTLQQYPI